MNRISIILVSLTLFTTTVKADGILISWSPRDLTGMTEERFNTSKKWSTSEIINKLKTAREWPDIYLLLIASKQYNEDKAFIDSLINQISDMTQSQIKLTSRLIIWERITSGDILFEGKGVQISDDLFKVSGRANWLLRNLTGKNFGNIRINFTTDSLLQLKEKWISWRTGVNALEFKNPYETLVKGLDEIKSIEAFEAIIISLKNTEEKERLTKECLKKLYNLNELPTDLSSPANFCSPDTYSNLYLTKLSGIEEKHSFDWWMKWWEENKSRLVWNKETAKFDLQK